MPAQRLGKAEEIAEAVAFLLRGEAAYVNGTTLVVDGGLGIALAATK
ncbi:MAG: SDR family oxidoreductase [Zavarzinia sp.]|nr:SDR family oxidoreductase [Zavarzinia sp.]